MIELVTQAKRSAAIMQPRERRRGREVEEEEEYEYEGGKTGAARLAQFQLDGTQSSFCERKVRTSSHYLGITCISCRHH